MFTIPSRRQLPQPVRFLAGRLLRILARIQSLIVWLGLWIQIKSLPRSDVPKSRDLHYALWLYRNYPTFRDLKKMERQAGRWRYQPRISLLMPVRNAGMSYLKQAVESVFAQVYPYWELCLVDDASPAEEIRAFLGQCAARDARVKILCRQDRGGISRCTNSALALATGEFVALLDQDDVLCPHALYEVAGLLNRHPDADMIYSDQDKMDEASFVLEPFLKPDWSPDTLRSLMYTGHLGVYRTGLVRALGGFREGLEGAQDWDLVLRLTEGTARIYHLAKILYHWRWHGRSVSMAPEWQGRVRAAQERALGEALARGNESGRFEPVSGLPGVYTARYDVRSPGKVSVIIPTRDQPDWLGRCLDSVFGKARYPDFEVMVIDNGSVCPEVADLLRAWRAREPFRFRYARREEPFNYSRLNNFGVSETDGEYLLFLNDDTEPLSDGWIGAMVEQAQRPCIGAVGALLLYPDKRIQHAGVVLGIHGSAGHRYRGSRFSARDYLGRVRAVSNVAAVTGACLMCRRDLFRAAGGFDENLAVAMNDVSLCLKFLDLGVRNIYLPHVMLYHCESRSRGPEDTRLKARRLEAEKRQIRERWRNLVNHDPYYNCNLSRDSEDYRIRI